MPKRKLVKKKSSRPKWKEEKKADFIINLDSQTISDIKASIDQARQNIDAVNKNTIDNVCIQITDLFSKSATKSFNHSESFVETMESPNHKRWFGSQCKSARRKYHLARKCNHINPHDNDDHHINIDVTDDDEILNSSITEAEILKCLKSLKNNKCPANDNITNEYLKNSTEKNATDLYPYST